MVLENLMEFQCLLSLFYEPAFVEEGCGMPRQARRLLGLDEIKRAGKVKQRVPAMRGRRIPVSS
jgi:hypothetical protein